MPGQIGKTPGVPSSQVDPTAGSSEATGRKPASMERNDSLSGRVSQDGGQSTLRRTASLTHLPKLPEGEAWGIPVQPQIHGAQPPQPFHTPQPTLTQATRGLLQAGGQVAGMVAQRLAHAVVDFAVALNPQRASATLSHIQNFSAPALHQNASQFTQKSGGTERLMNGLEAAKAALFPNGTQSLERAASNLVNRNPYGAMAKQIFKGIQNFDSGKLHQGVQNYANQSSHHGAFLTQALGALKGLFTSPQPMGFQPFPHAVPPAGVSPHNSPQPMA